MSVCVRFLGNFQHDVRICSRTSRAVDRTCLFRPPSDGNWRKSVTARFHDAIVRARHIHRKKRTIAWSVEACRLLQIFRFQTSPRVRCNISRSGWK